MRTGDSGWVDPEGQLWLAGRLKDVIRSGSENVAAADTERVSFQCHGNFLTPLVLPCMPSLLAR